MTDERIVSLACCHGLGAIGWTDVVRFARAVLDEHDAERYTPPGSRGFAAAPRVPSCIGFIDDEDAA
jgi:hypothetical protein